MPPLKPRSEVGGGTNTELILPGTQRQGPRGSKWECTGGTPRLHRYSQGPRRQQDSFLHIHRKASEHLPSGQRVRPPKWHSGTLRALHSWREPLAVPCWPAYLIFHCDPRGGLPKASFAANNIGLAWESGDLCHPVPVPWLLCALGSLCLGHHL